MKRIMLELDDATSACLDEVAPARSRKRSEFIRAAILQAVRQHREQATEAAYGRRPDSEPVYIDVGAWEGREPKGASRRKGTPRSRSTPGS